MSILGLRLITSSVLTVRHVPQQIKEEEHNIFNMIKHTKQKFTVQRNSQ